MKTWILIGITIIVVLSLAYLFTSTQEGFLTVDPDVVNTQHKLLQLEGERRYNDLARLQSPLTVIPADEINATVSQTVPAPNRSAESLLSMLGFSQFSGADDGSGKQGAGVEQTGMVQQKINFCESLQTVDCNLLDDPRMAECGFCHKNGKSSRGKTHRGGLYISSDDQIRTNQRAGKDGKANYSPTFGTCDSTNFTLMKDNCEARENTLECQRAGAATNDNKCGQCFGSSPPGTTGLLYMGNNKLGGQTVTIVVSHPGSHTGPAGASTVVEVGGQTYTFAASNKPDCDPKQLAITVAEGQTMKITIYGVPRFWCGWLVNGNGMRAVGINLGETSIEPEGGLVIAGGSNNGPLLKVMNSSPDAGDFNNFKGRIPANTLWYQRRKIIGPAVVRSYYANGDDGTYREKTPHVKAIAGAQETFRVNGEGLRYLYANMDDGATRSYPHGSTVQGSEWANQATINMTVPASLVEPYYADDQKDCPSGPIVLTGAGAALMGANSCFATDGSYNPSLGCLRMLFRSAGGTPAGTLYPKSEAEAKALSKGSLDATTSYLNNLSNIAYYGVDMNGGPVKFKEQKEASMQILGIALNNPCDGPASKTGPHSAECLDYIWRTSNSNALDGQSIDTDKLPYNQCSKNGSLAPLNQDGSVNQSNVNLLNRWGPIPQVRGIINLVRDMAHNNSAGFESQSAYMRYCYGVNLKPPPESTKECPAPVPTDYQCFGPSKLKQPEVFYVSDGGYNTAKADANAVCQSYSARLASSEELGKAQLMGADWCATGWVSDSNDAKYPISTTIQGGCGNGSTGVMTYTPPSRKAGVNCFGKKPAEGTQGIAKHNVEYWFNQHSDTDPPHISLYYLQNGQRKVLRHAGFQMYNHDVDPNHTNQLFQKDSSFEIVPANNGQAGCVSFRSINYPDRFIRHKFARCILDDRQSSYSDAFPRDSSWKIVAALNGDPKMCSIQSTQEFSTYYMAPSSITGQDIFISQINMNDQNDKNRACWYRSGSMFVANNRPFNGRIPACRMVDDQISCVGWGGSTVALWDDEKTCNEWADPVGNPGSITYPVVTSPGPVMAKTIEKYMRTRV